MIGLTKFIKGCISFKDLEQMPNRFIHTLFKQYNESMKTESGKKAAAAEQIQDELEDAMT